MGIEEKSLEMDITLKNNWTIRVEFDYNQDIIQLIKKETTNYSFNKEEKVWELGIEELPVMESLFNANVSDKAKERYDYLYSSERDKIPENFEVKGLKDDIELYDFQKIAVKQMVEMGDFLLGDGMGLGKTAMTIATALKLREQGKIDNFLVICPSSLKYQWKEEIKKFSNAPVTVIDGDKDERYDQWTDIDNDNTDSFFYIMNYALLTRDEFPRLIHWGGIALDEATYIKNPQAKRTKRAKELNRKYSYALTGTPVEGRASDIYSILEFINQENMEPFYIFKQRYLQVEKKNYGGNKFEKVTGYKDLDSLHKRLKPKMIRRKKSDTDILDELPERTISTRKVDLTKDQWELYNYYKNRVFDRIDEGEPFAGFIQCIRMLTSDPAILNNSEADSVEKTIPDAKSAKFSALQDAIQEIYLSNQKVLVFTNYKEMARKIKEEFGNSYMVTGNLNSKQKNEEIQKFKDTSKPGLLVATDAIQYGQDIPQATNVIHYDLPFNPSTLDQRNDRIYRIGQEYPVNVIKLVATNTIEEGVMEILETKRELSDAIIKGGRFKLDAEKTKSLL